MQVGWAEESGFRVQGLGRFGLGFTLSVREESVYGRSVGRNP